MRNRVNMLTTAAIEVPEDLAGVSLPVVFDYDPADPLAVTVRFWGEEIEVTWVIARDLLRDGLVMRCGPGDVTAWAGVSNPDRYHLRMKSGSLVTVVSFEASEVRTFLSLAYDSVAAGDEVRPADVDSELNAIFGEAA